MSAANGKRLRLVPPVDGPHPAPRRRWTWPWVLLHLAGGTFIAWGMWRELGYRLSTAAWVLMAMIGWGATMAWWRDRYK